MAERTSEAGHRRVPKGRAFEDEVAHLYRLLGYTVEQNIQICQKKVDILARYQPPASHLEHRVIIECKDEKENVAQNQRVLQFIGLLRLARQSDVADAAEIITRRPWGDQAKGASSSAGIGLYTFEEKLSQLIDFRGYLRRVVHDFEHYDELVAPDGRILKAPVIDVMTASDLFRTYVPLVCRVLDEPQPGHLETLEPYVERWLDDPDHNHLSILGDFGTGKSSFCLRLTYTLAKRCREDPVTSRIPLFISLRDYATAVNIRQLITDLLLNKYGVPIANYSVFNRFLESRRLILIFDGFDEMATKTDRALTIRNRRAWVEDRTDVPQSLFHRHGPHG